MKYGIKTELIEPVIKIIGLVLTVATIFFTYRTYVASEKWKQAEFTIAKFKEFSSNKSVGFVNVLLDNRTCALPLFGEGSMVYLSDDALESALIVDTVNFEFSDTEIEIRKIFKEYFDQLSLFNRYAKSNLIKYEQIKPYILYQTEIIADPKNKRKLKPLRRKIWDYLHYYGFTDVVELYENIGFKIK